MARSQKRPEPSGKAIQRDMREFADLARQLEPAHTGEYVMIDIRSRRYVIGPTISAVHREFIETFGADASGYCLRVGASPFATV